MNRYYHHFAAKCPSDGATVIYHLTIKTNAVVMVEAIALGCEFLKPEYHEAIADELAAKFGGRQKLVAIHQGVQIVTKRGYDA